MDIQTYLRPYFTGNIRPIFIKEKCEKCGSTENLELHHVTQHSLLVMETLKDLNLDYKDSTEYTELELKNIINIMLGKQIRIRYKTLCLTCHDEEHKSYKQSNKIKATYEKRYKASFKKEHEPTKKEMFAIIIEDIRDRKYDKEYFENKKGKKVKCIKRIKNRYIEINREWICSLLDITNSNLKYEVLNKNEEVENVNTNEFTIKI